MKHLSTTQAAKQYGIKPWRLRSLAKEGKIKSIHHNTRNFYFLDAEIKKYLRNQNKIRKEYLVFSSDFEELKTLGFFEKSQMNTQSDYIEEFYV